LANDGNRSAIGQKIDGGKAITRARANGEGAAVRANKADSATTNITASIATAIADQEGAVRILGVA
jgi:hypothetical protein